MRGQAHTLEGVVAGLILLSSIVFALQVTAVTPLSASTSSQHIENQQASLALGVLSNAAEHGALRRAVLFWNESESKFHGTDSFQYYTGGGPPNEFGESLNETFLEDGVAFNVMVFYTTSDGDRESQRMVYLGAPSDNAATISRFVTIYDDTPIYNASAGATSTNVSASRSFYAPDAAPDSSVYNVLEVKVIVWRM